ncbi:Cupredoxin [Aspergillus avenaceus]|uniref:Cupredoxin n=1 Tax=Aspergillus avenaceus TaxID=36643 RepID=A0A5N6U7I9_ASPAV|nr:Cupredoxin [Aspergillus avenaceus]
MYPRLMTGDDGAQTKALASKGSQPTDLDINTNCYTSNVTTGVIREYWFNIINSTAAPDGVPRPMMLVNGQYPGPTIKVNWGDTVKVHVQSNLQDNGTSIHFHSVQQSFNNQMDGAVSITQCPIAPGSNYTYVWRAEQYGTSFYHSHFSLQAWEGVFGRIVVHGPATAVYDKDLGVLFLNDWSHQTFNNIYIEALEVPAVLRIDTVGQRFRTDIFTGKRYRIHLVNTAINTHFKFSINNHNITVIASDFVPIVPFTTNNIPIGMGQRYDIIIKTDQPVDNYWLRAVPQSYCTDIVAADNIKGILHYSGADSTTDPSTTKWNYNSHVYCEDMPMSNLVPALALDAEISNATYNNDTIAPMQLGNPGIYLWRVGGRVFNVSWNDPTIRHPTAPTPDDGAIEFPTPDKWTIFVITETLGVPHPIHLHGHDFYILAQGSGALPQNITFQTKNPPRRDVAMIPAREDGGYLVIAFPADNPGAWLLHCHMGFHASAGFAQQIVERRDEFWRFLDVDLLNRTCVAWDAFAAVNPYGVQFRGMDGLYESGI